jgi:Mg/Co/Ni transporter MgtE
MSDKLKSINVARILAEADESDKLTQQKVLDNLDQSNLLAYLDNMDRDQLVALVQYYDAFVTGQYLMGKRNEMLVKALSEAMGQNTHSRDDAHIAHIAHTGMYI